MNITPVTNQELEFIDDILDAYSTEHCILNASELDGFLTAIAISPELIEPQTWLPKIWETDAIPEWPSKKEFEKFQTIATKMLNYNVYMLIEEPDEFAGMYLICENDDESDNKGINVVNDWCLGFLRGTNIWMRQIGEYPEDIQTNLYLVRELAGLNIDETDLDEYEQRTAHLDQTIVALYQYFAQTRKSVGTIVRDAPKVGRNDPCPCGSGKKHKQCCLH